MAPSCSIAGSPSGEAGDDDDPGPHDRTFGIIDAKPSGSPHKVGDGALNLSSMEMRIDPRAEWKQMFNETWRQERDFFFEASMNGVDWAKERERYAPLLPDVADRYDLTYLLGEMVGELSNSHTYVGGGDYPNLHPVNLGLLGVDYELDAASGLYRFKKIYPGENWDAGLRSPLTEPGVDVKEGDYLIAVNGRDLKAPQAAQRVVREHRRRERDAYRQLQAHRDGRAQRGGKTHLQRIRLAPARYGQHQSPQG